PLRPLSIVDPRYFPVMGVETRRASRIIAVDREGRVLLFQFARASGERYWATPGGGLEEGESFEEAAAREAREELGVDAVGLVPLWERTAEFPFAGRSVLQREKYFLLLVPIPEFSEAVLAVQREEGISKPRWWTVGELAHAQETVFPESLAALLRGIRIPPGAGS
ncbi:MAG TPA: NUDIX domain-containing protein, partial [Candidatus Eisenbacteria bacterium]